MRLDTFKKIMAALNEADVRYLVAGGLAVVAHGYGRLTVDIDLVIQLTPENIMRTFDVLAQLGYRPRVPITAEQFADETQREGWIRDKGMMVLTRISHQPSTTTADMAPPASLRSVGRPRRIAEDTPSAGLDRKPCGQCHLSHFTTKAGEKSGQYSFSSQYVRTPVDLFVQEPFDFDEVYDKALEETLDENITCKFVDLSTLISMKEKAGRERDLDDVRHLRAIQDEEKSLANT